MLLLVIALGWVSNAISQRDQSSASSCWLDSRVSALRCRNVDLAHIQLALRRRNEVFSTLDVRHCALARVRSRLDAPPDVRRVTLANSGLRALSTDAFDTVRESLTYLDLSGNELSHLPVALLDLARLEELDLSSNRIKQLPHAAAFNGLNALTRLDLSLNR